MPALPLVPPAKFMASSHALRRMAERFPGHSFMDELEQAIPWGVQAGIAAYFLSPCGAVFVIEERNIVSNVLMESQARANMSGRFGSGASRGAQIKLAQEIQGHSRLAPMPAAPLPRELTGDRTCGNAGVDHRELPGSTFVRPRAKPQYAGLDEVDAEKVTQIATDHAREPRVRPRRFRNREFIDAGYSMNGAAGDLYRQVFQMEMHSRDKNGFSIKAQKRHKREKNAAMHWTSKSGEALG